MKLKPLGDRVIVRREQSEDKTSGGIILPDSKGISRSRVFPGLWIDGRALLARESSRVLKVLKQGLASREYAAFVRRLQAAHRKHTTK